MKKELFALALLAALTAGALWNLRRLSILTETVMQAADTAAAAAACGEWELARQRGDQAALLWEHAESYTHLVLPHGQLEAATEAFCAMLGALEGQDNGDFLAAYCELKERISNLYAMEKPTLGSIF